MNNFIHIYKYNYLCSFCKPVNMKKILKYCFDQTRPDPTRRVRSSRGYTGIDFGRNRPYRPYPGAISLKNIFNATSGTFCNYIFGMRTNAILYAPRTTVLCLVGFLITLYEQSTNNLRTIYEQSTNISYLADILNNY